ncbi:MAG TPA: ABC transporter substrate-binding protein [Candidatus Limnocylindria bacterium]|nr:ABC transporter substrate-binding protein [Candidatus Limnocylindria bacterium]
MSKPSSALRVASALFVLALVGCTAPAPATPGPATPGPATPGPATPGPATPAGEAIVVGASLSLTGIFGATGIIHDIAGKQFVEQLNDEGGLLDRPVEWMVLDDESAAAGVADLYERLITQEEVDLLMGPYATPLILAALSVAERNGMVLPHHTSVHRPFMNYECQFPGWSIGPTPNEFVPNQLYDALESLPEPPQTIAFVTNETGSTGYVVHGQPDVDEPAALSIAEDRGMEVVADIRYTPSAEHTWDAVAAELASVEPDFVFMSTLGVDSLNLLNAMEQIGYRPPLAFSLFPAPGPLLGAGEVAEGHLSVSMFEPNEPILERMGPEVRAIVEEFESRAQAAGLPYTAFETQATGSWTAWEILAEGVRGAGSLDHEAICDYLLANGAETTFHGHLTFDPADGNYWPTTQGIKQIQDGDWVMVWPADSAAAPLVGPSN